MIIGKKPKRKSESADDCIDKVIGYLKESKENRDECDDYGNRIPIR